MKRYNSAKRLRQLTKVEKICRYLLEMTRSRIKSLVQQMMAYALAKTYDAYIESKVEAATTNSTALAGDNTITAAEIRGGMKTLMEADVDTNECNFVVSPALYTAMLGISDFVDASKMGAGPSGLKNGQIGMLYGMPVLHSTVMGASTSTGVEVGYIFHPSAVSAARQLEPRVQAEYSVDFLGMEMPSA